MEMENGLLGFFLFRSITVFTGSVLLADTDFLSSEDGPDDIRGPWVP